MYEGSNFSTSSPSLLSVLLIIVRWMYGYNMKCKLMALICIVVQQKTTQHRKAVVVGSTPIDLCRPGLPVPHHLLEFAQVRIHWISDTIQSSHPLLPPSPTAFFPSIRVFSNESVAQVRWSKFWSFSFSISPSNEYSELLSFRIDWFDLLAVQGTLKSLLQHHSWKTSVLWRSTYGPALTFMHDYWKDHSLDYMDIC